MSPNTIDHLICHQVCHCICHRMQFITTFVTNFVTKFCTKFGDSLNSSPNLVTNLGTNSSQNTLGVLVLHDPCFQHLDPCFWNPQGYWPVETGRASTRRCLRSRPGSGVRGGWRRVCFFGESRITPETAWTGDQKPRPASRGSTSSQFPTHSQKMCPCSSGPAGENWNTKNGDR